MILLPLSKLPSPIAASNKRRSPSKSQSLESKDHFNHCIDAEWEEIFEEQMGQNSDPNEEDFSHADPVALYKKSKQLLLMRNHYYLNFYV